MNILKSNRILFGAFLISCTMMVQTHAMMGRYLVTLLGDACILSTAASMRTQTMSTKDEHELINNGTNYSQVNQLKRDAKKIEPYAPALLTVGSVLSVGGRLGMISKAAVSGLALAGLSIPVNTVLLATSYVVRLHQAPDASITDKAADKALDLYNRITGKKRDD